MIQVVQMVHSSDSDVSMVTMVQMVQMVRVSPYLLGDLVDALDDHAMRQEDRF